MSFSFDRVVKAFVEWDIGLDDAVFEDMEVARMYVREALANQEFEESLEELEADGLVSFDWVDLVSID